MRYDPPQVIPSGTTWPELRGLGLAGLVAAVAGASRVDLYAVTHLLGTDQDLADVRARLGAAVDGYLAGWPSGQADALVVARDAAQVFRVLAQAADEFGALVAQNPADFA